MILHTLFSPEKELDSYKPIPFNIELRCTHLTYKRTLELARKARRVFVLTYRRPLSQDKLKELLKYSIFVDTGAHTSRSNLHIQSEHCAGISRRILRSMHTDMHTALHSRRGHKRITKLAVPARDTAALLRLLRCTNAIPLLIATGYYGRPSRILYRRLGDRTSSRRLLIAGLRQTSGSKHQRKADEFRQIGSKCFAPLPPKSGWSFTYSVQKRTARSDRLGMYTYDIMKRLYRADRVGKETLLLAVAGLPVNHSLGPLVFNIFASLNDIDSVYFRIATEDPAVLIAAVRQLGVKGVSVTAPLKRKVVRYLKSSDVYVDATGAANTLIFDASGISGINTDCPAFEEILLSLKQKYGGSPRVLVLGCGATARSAVFASLRMQLETLVCARSGREAKKLASKFRVGSISAESLGPVSKSASIIINTTPYYAANGLARRACFMANSTLIESIYYPLTTPLVRRAEASHCAVIFGTDLYRRQAALQAGYFFGGGHAQKFNRISSIIIRYYKKHLWRRNAYLGRADLEEILFGKLPLSLR